MIRLTLSTCGLVLAIAAVVRADEALPAKGQVNFHKDIVPILANSCVKCHANTNRKGGLSMDTREKLLAGGDSGPAVIVGESGDSLLIDLVSGADPDMIMPAEGPRLPAEQIELLKAWIDQGLAWDEGFTFRKTQAAPLAPRRPMLPASKDPAANPIDRVLEPYYAQHAVKHSAVVDDRTYIRRVYLDTIGVLPSTNEIAAFIADASPTKRSALVDRVLSDRMQYAEHWLTFWNDALRNDYRGTGYIDGGRREITGWLYQALAENMPYDQFVRELINPSQASEGFINGIVWRGVVNASQVPPVQAAQNVSQVFMGINLKCASCHDSFINDWKLTDAYGLAGIFSDSQLEIHRCDKPIGEYAKIKFLYPELGSVDAAAPRSKRLAQLSSVITNPANGRLTRTIVNRLWARLLGRGLIEPVDEMDEAAWSSDLLDYLAVDLADHGYNLKHTLALILTSRAYQLPAVAFAEQSQEDFVFRGPVVKRMNAEQFVDAIASLTKTRAARGTVDIPQVIARNAVSKASWIWSDSAARESAPAGRILFRKPFELPELADRAWFLVACDDRASVYLNGKLMLKVEGARNAQIVDIRPQLIVGSNIIAIEGRNHEPPPAAAGSSGNPAGLLVYGVAEVLAKNGAAATKRYEVASDPSWLCSPNDVVDWLSAKIDREAWQPAAIVAPHRSKRA